jgi:hypothetical protein
MDWPQLDWRNVARWIAGGGALAGMAGIVVNETLLSPQYEVLYSSGVSAVLCNTINGKQACTFIYAASVGNTGRQAQEKVRIAWPIDMRAWRLGTEVADIIGSARKTQQPQIQSTYDSAQTVYAIGGLMPNTVVSFEASCYACTPAQLRAMQQVRPVVQARGKVSEADPRVSALTRGVMNALKLVGLF